MDELSWESHPFRQKAPRSWLIAAALLGVCLVMNLAFGGWIWTVLAVLFLGGALSSWLLPTRYRLDEAGVEMRFLLGSRRRRWSDFRAVRADPEGLYLSPDLFLPCASGRLAEVEAFCRARIGGA